MMTVFDGSIWVMGGQVAAYSQTGFLEDLKAGRPIQPALPPLRDVWRTSDGVSWELVTDVAGWRHSDFPMTAVFKDRIFIMVAPHHPPPKFFINHTATNYTYTPSIHDPLPIYCALHSPLHYLPPRVNKSIPPRD